MRQPREPWHVCYLDGKRFESRAHHVSACHLRAKLMAYLTGRNLYLQGSGPWFHDKLLSDLDTIPMGGRVYNVPHASR